MSAILLGAARALPAALIAPPLGGPSLLARVVVAALLVALSAPALTVEPTMILVIREIGVGLTLGLVASVPFRAAQAGGLLVDDGLGLRRGALGDAWLFLALALWAALGGPRLLAVAWGESYLAFPVAGGPSLTMAVEAGARIVAAGIAIAAPALAALLLVDLAGALVVRAQPVVAGQGAALRLLIALLTSALALAAGLNALAEAGLATVGKWPK